MCHRFLRCLATHQWVGFCIWWLMSPHPCRWLHPFFQPQLDCIVLPRFAAPLLFVGFYMLQLHSSLQQRIDARTPALAPGLNR